MSDVNPMSMMNAYTAAHIESKENTSPEQKEEEKNNVIQAANTIQNMLSDNENISGDTAVWSFNSDEDVITRQDFSAKLYELTGADENSIDDEINLLYDVIDWDENEGLSKVELSNLFDVNQDSKITFAEIKDGLYTDEEQIDEMLAAYEQQILAEQTGGISNIVTFENNTGLNAEEVNPDAFKSNDVITYKEEVQRQVLKDYLDDYNLTDFKAYYSEDGVCCLSRDNEDGSRDFYRVVEDGNTVKIISTHIGEDTTQTTVSDVDSKYASEVMSVTNAQRDRESAYIIAHGDSTTPDYYSWALDTTDYAAKMSQSASYAEFSHWAQSRVHQAEAQGIDIMGGSDFIQTNDAIYEEWRKTNSQAAELSEFILSDGTKGQGYYGMDASGHWGYYADSELTQKLDNGGWAKSSDGGECILDYVDVKPGPSKGTLLPSGSVQYTERAGKTVTFTNAGAVYQVKYDKDGYPQTVTYHNSTSNTVREYNYDSRHNGKVTTNRQLNTDAIDAASLSYLPNAESDNDGKGVSSREIQYARTGILYSGPGATKTSTKTQDPATINEYYQVIELRSKGINL